MAREVINVGAAPNDGQGDPIRTAYIKTNNNFAELYSAVQLVPPPTLLGSAGNKAGMIAYSPTAFYYCFQDYDGSSEIWGELPLAQAPPPTLLGSAGNKAGMIAYSPTTFYYCFQDYDGSSEIWGELLTGITGSEILNGTSNVSVAASSNVTVSIAGISNVAVFYASGFSVTGNVNVSANVTTGNVSGTTGTFTNVGGTLTTVAQNNITSVGTLTSLAVTGNITSGNLSGTSIVGTLTTVAQNNITSVGTLTSLAVTGNITSGNLQGINIAGTLTTAAQTNITSVGTLTSLGVTGNITTGNANASGNISATFFYGDGSLLTNVVSVGASAIVNGTSNIAFTGSGGNATITIGGTANIGVWATTGVYITGLGNATGNLNGANLTTPGVVTATGNLNGNNATITNAVVAATGAFTGNVTTGNIQGTAHSGTTGTFTGNITAGNLSVGTGEITVGNIVNANGNGIGNIGSSTLYFNTVFAQATSAQYADLAEMYQGDRYYSPGTVVCFGGSNEVTIAEKDHDVMVAGIVSTRPAYTMNSTLTGPTAVAIALAGRVPCNVQGPVLRGQMLVTAGNGRARAELNPAIGTVIGKALQDFNGSVGVIEIVVGRL
jgi:hypothetical protein